MPVPLQIKDLRVRSLDQDFNEVTWKIADTSAEVLDFTFQVLRSESPEGPWDELGVPFEDRYLFIDNTIKIANRWRKYFYVLRITHKATGDLFDSDAISKDPEADLVAAELRRHMQLLFQEFNGRCCWIVPVRTFGQRCSCFNQTLQRPNKGSCLTCFGTGFVRGYMHPIESWMQIEPNAKAQQNSVIGQQQQSNTTARLASYPPLKPYDVVIEGENRRWRVISVVQTEHVRAAVHQEVQLHELQPTDIEFRIPLELDKALKDIWLAPARNYTNPHNLESFEDANLSGIFGLYRRRKVK